MATSDKPAIERAGRGGRAGWFIQVALLLLVLLGVRAYQTRQHATGAAPKVSARLLDGTEVSLGGPGEQAVVLHFWATWCGVCRAEEGNIEALSKEHRVITVASRSGSADQVRRYMRARQLSFPVVNDPSGRLATLYGVRAYPTSFFVDAAGVIDSSEVGYTSTLGLKLRHWLASL